MHTRQHKGAHKHILTHSFLCTCRAGEQLAVLGEQLEAIELESTSAEGTVERVLTYANKPATEAEIMTIAELRVNIAQLTSEDKNELGKWLNTIENVDILRFLRVHATPEKTWQALRATAKVCMHVCMCVRGNVYILQFLRVHATPGKTWHC
jgi:hypothetical protein